MTADAPPPEAPASDPHAPEPHAPEPLAPGATIGILGAGQLGRMLAEAAADLGFRVHTYAPEADPPAARVADRHTNAAYEDEAALARFAEAIDVATYEFENIPPLTVRRLAQAVPVRPDDTVLAVCQDRLAEKTFLRELGINTAPFAPVARVSDGAQAVATVGGEGIMKARRFGYDGKGQARLRPGDDPGVAFEACGGNPAILEGFVRFEAEISQVAARDVMGEMAFFEPSRNVHEDGILRRSVVPSGLPRGVLDRARETTAHVLETLDYVGVLAVEFFYGPEIGLVANEMAPRVHNSGHWTREACVTSQFEQHVRAVVGWPLGDVTRNLDAEMENLIGAEAEGWLAYAAEPRTRLTLYGKREARPGRKMGHVVRVRARKPWSVGSALEG